jgi:hypothetical protein
MEGRAQSIEFSDSLAITAEDHFIKGTYEPPG